MDTVAVEIATSAVVVLGGARVGVPGKDLRIAQRHTRVEGIGDRSVPQRVGGSRGVGCEPPWLSAGPCGSSAAVDRVA